MSKPYDIRRILYRYTFLFHRIDNVAEVMPIFIYIYISFKITLGKSYRTALHCLVIVYIETHN